MKTYLIDFARHKQLFTVCRVLIITVALVLVSVLSLNYILGAAIYVETAALSGNESVIIIDAGHGGEDSGAISKDGIYEKNLNLEISYELGNALINAGYAVVYTRTEDKLLYTEEENIKGIRKISDLKNRVSVAGNYPNAIFISIHMNSYGKEQYSGFQAYYKDDENSRILASKIQESVKGSLQENNSRTIKSGKSIYVLENSPITAVLLECGFLSNAEECKKLCEKEYQKQLCFAIVCGIIEYKKQID